MICFSSTSKIGFIGAREILQSPCKWFVLHDFEVVSVSHPGSFRNSCPCVSLATGPYISECSLSYSIPQYANHTRLLNGNTNAPLAFADWLPASTTTTGLPIAMVHFALARLDIWWKHHLGLPDALTQRCSHPLIGPVEKLGQLRLF
jgi:hypothetical protein